MLQSLIAFAKEAHAVVDWPYFIRLSGAWTAVLLCWYQFMCWYFTNVRKDPLPLSEKRKAWFCSFLISSLSTPLGVIYAVNIFKADWDPSIMLERDVMSQTILILFLTYLVIDMCLGLREYRHEFGILSGCKWSTHASLLLSFLSGLNPRSLLVPGHVHAPGT